MSAFAAWQSAAFHGAVRAFEQGRLGHALLLVGPPHMGKHAVAEALAKRILCASPGKDGFACGACRSCQLFGAQQVGLATMQAHADLQRVGLEPNDKGDKLRTEITVDQVRRLGEWFSLTAQFGGAQVAVVEPADLMNHQAANALLKTLEEPAPNRFLILVTSRPGRLPATIRSRCQRIEFPLPPPSDALDWLVGQGVSEADAMAGLAAARDNPGLASAWLADGGLALRDEVRGQLRAVAVGKAGVVETAQQWLADDQGELRLRFAADLALELAARGLGAIPGADDSGRAAVRFSGLSEWFDAINRSREQLRSPLRNDLVLAGLLREWRNMFQAAR